VFLAAALRTAELRGRRMACIVTVGVTGQTRAGEVGWMDGARFGWMWLRRECALHGCPFGPWPPI
jgi:hypothetical protein